MRPASCTAARNLFATPFTNVVFVLNGAAMRGIRTSPTSSGCRATNASTSSGFAGLPISSATSIVKKSHGAIKRSTFFRLMWSASRKYGVFQPSSFAAASAATRVFFGSLPMIVCSRLDLFHTGATSIPPSFALMQAANWAFAWCANRSPTPTEYFGKRSSLAITVSNLKRVRKSLGNCCLEFDAPLHCRVAALSAYEFPVRQRNNCDRQHLSVHKTALVCPQPQPRIGDEENLLTTDRVPSVLQP